MTWNLISIYDYSRIDPLILGISLIIHSCPSAFYIFFYCIQADYRNLTKDPTTKLPHITRTRSLKSLLFVPHFLMRHYLYTTEPEISSENKTEPWVWMDNGPGSVHSFFGNLRSVYSLNSDLHSLGKIQLIITYLE